MTVEEHIRLMIGDLMLSVARLSAENDALKLEVKAAIAVLAKPKK